MQVEIETKPKGYEPKTLKITFETEEEYKMFGDMMAHEVSIPELVYGHDPSKQTKLMQMIQRTQDTM